MPTCFPRFDLFTLYMEDAILHCPEAFVLLDRVRKRFLHNGMPSLVGTVQVWFVIGDEPTTCVH